MDSFSIAQNILQNIFFRMSMILQV
uniref:Uncharacterized protein n=1 Tax=Arundo donax TaxID=35708 RepID=A0A0A9HGK1_ARUDO